MGAGPESLYGTGRTDATGRVLDAFARGPGLVALAVPRLTGIEIDDARRDALAVGFPLALEGAIELRPAGYAYCSPEQHAAQRATATRVSHKPISAKSRPPTQRPRPVRAPKVVKMTTGYPLGARLGVFHR
jgi:hypothetical protein